MYYELDEFDALESLLESMRNYIRRKKVMGYHKSNFMNITKLTKKLIKVNPYSPQQLTTLKSEITETNPITTSDKEWLLEKIGQF